MHLSQLSFTLINNLNIINIKWPPFDALLQEGSNQNKAREEISINLYNSHHRTFYLVSHIIVVM